MSDLIVGERIGAYVVLVDDHGIRHAVRLGSVLAASDGDEAGDTTVLQLPGGRAVLIREPLETVLDWLGR